ncbi:MAG: 4-alpha-glucanotransferase [Alphaproteobacteria bacterium]|nr:4-alpha-glucanotransferase [Alphaproteobacteria bacterium]MCW5744325.1 4-alpha-glucanotransferase [Alphaproteobacteria bacterium]
MSDEAVRALAREAGIAVEWTDASGQPQIVSLDVLRRMLAVLGLPADSPEQVALSRDHLCAPPPLPPMITTTIGVACRVPGLSGSAELRLESGEGLALVGNELPAIVQPGYHVLRTAEREILVAAAPRRCVTLDDVAAGRPMFGLAVQTYALRRAGDDGIGDTTALADLARQAARHGADALTVSPAHALATDGSSHFTPYSPSSRLFLNALMADPACVLGDERVRRARAGLQIDDGELIDWPAVSRAKRILLRRLHQEFVRDGLPADDLRRFVSEAGPRLVEHARFDARGREAEIDYLLFEQWIADRALAGAQRAARDAGMRIGLIADLAVGLDRNGSQARSRPQDMLDGVSIGAPPDSFNMKGQGWGLGALSPRALVDSGFEPFLATLRAALRHAGGVRIDHAMGMMRLWLIPDGAPPTEGAYLAYPLDDLLRLVALESHRHRAVVIGEDLGTVPPAFRERCREAGIAGMDVMWFQRDDSGFLPPRRWRGDAIAMTTTHDLPTVAGWWQGADIGLRAGLGLASEADAQRPQDRSALWRTCVEAGVAQGVEPPPHDPAPAVDAAIGLVAAAPSPLAIVPLEDLLGLSEQPNLPGTVDEHPNWRRRLKFPVDQLLEPAPVQARLKRLAARSS